MIVQAVEQTITDNRLSTNLGGKESAVALSCSFWCFYRTVHKCRVLYRGFLLHGLHQSEGIGGVESMYHVSVAVEVGIPVVLVAIRLVVPLAAAVFGFTDVGQQIFVKPDVVLQLVVLPRFVIGEGMNQLAGAMNQIRASLRTVAAVVVLVSLSVPFATAVDA